MTSDDPQTQKDQAGPADALLAKMHHAAYTGDLAGVRRGIEAGADVNGWHEATGLTALHLAVGTNNLALVKYFLETAGAELVPDRSGRWPTVIAAQCYASEELCDYIVEQEAKVLET